MTDETPADPAAALVAWLREEAPWAVQHVAERIGPDAHQAEGARLLVENAANAAAMIEASAGALRKALPVMRRGLYEYLWTAAVAGDVASIAPIEWAEIPCDLAAIRAAESCVGRQPDLDGVDTAWLDAALERAPR